MKLNLYYAPQTISLASIIVLEESGLPYDLTRIDFAQTQQRSQDYLTINLKGRVPALVTDRGILTETPAILTYVATCAPKVQLLPEDPWSGAQVQSAMAYFASTVHVAHAHRMRGHRWADGEAAQAAMRARVPGNMTDCFTLIEKDILTGPWIAGDAYSIADAHLFTIARWLHSDGVDVNKFPGILAHVDRMNARPAVARALEKAV